MLAFGSFAYGGVVGRSRQLPMRAAQSGLLLGVCAALLAVFQITGPDRRITDLAEIFTATTFGRAWIFHISLSAALLLLMHIRPQARMLLTMLAGASLASYSVIGHAIAAADDAVAIGVAIQSSHLLGIGAWAGSIPPLLRDLREGHKAAELALRGFSTYGWIPVTVVAISGAVNVFVLTGSVLPNPNVVYGQLVIAKVTIYAAILSIAAVNRFVLAPARKIRQIAILAKAELTLFVIAIFTASLLGSLPPWG